MSPSLNELSSVGNSMKRKLFIENRLSSILHVISELCHVRRLLKELLLRFYTVCFNTEIDF